MTQAQIDQPDAQTQLALAAEPEPEAPEEARPPQRGVPEGWQPPEALIEYAQLLQAYKAAMREGEDYGVIPGADKPTLFQPGADTLCRAGGFVVGRPEELDVVEDFERGFFSYRVALPIYDRRGRLAGYGVGSCNSEEKQYARRGEWVPEFKLTERQRALAQEEGWETEERVSKRTGQSFIWVKLPPNESGGEGRGDLANTILKMAVKRAYISGALRATGAHRIFTQDIGDNEIEGELAASAPPSPQRVAAQPRPLPPPPIRQGPDPRQADAPITEPQLRAIRSLLKRAFGEDEQRAYNFLQGVEPSACQGANIKLRHLTQRQAAHVIDALNQVRPKP
ncbi:MAG: hypothetical protein QW838_04165 [Candidatus Nitrosotenuis sp.]